MISIDVYALHGDNIEADRTHKSVGKTLRSSDWAESLSGLPYSRSRNVRSSGKGVAGGNGPLVGAGGRDSGRSGEETSSPYLQYETTDDMTQVADELIRLVRSLSSARFQEHWNMEDPSKDVS